MTKYNSVVLGQAHNSRLCQNLLEFSDFYLLRCRMIDLKDSGLFFKLLKPIGSGIISRSQNDQLFESIFNTRLYNLIDMSGSGNRESKKTWEHPFIHPIRQEFGNPSFTKQGKSWAHKFLFR